MKRMLVEGTRETTELTPAGTLVRVAVYRYTLDGLGPFEYRVAVEEDTPEKLVEAIEKKEEILSSGELVVSPEVGKPV